MASRSKKRRRVLAASCILAALIVAGSSFAWFTSKDEVTNRLSANADYDVQIVESFAPPANWLPGQVVNKDVYAVNAGSIGAFVEETVSSVMTVTKETKVATRDDDCTTLTEAERYSVEAGSYLALVVPDEGAVSTHQPGEKIVSFTVDNSKNLDGYSANTVVTDFTPDVSGVYVFRRSIEVDGVDQSETFKYNSYYYDKDTDTYYKTVLTSVTPDTVADFSGDNVRTDGNLSAANVVYFKDVTTKEVPKLTYDATKHRLVATVEGTSYINDDALKAYAEAYDKAIHNYQLALAERTRAVDEDDAATDTLKTKLDALTAAEIAEANAEKAFKEALAAYNAIVNEYNAAKSDYDTAKANVESLIDELYTTSTGLVLDVPTSLQPDAYLTYDGSGDYATTFNETATFVAKLEAAYANRDSSTDQDAFLNDLKAWINGGSITPDNYTGSETFNANSYDNLDDLVALLSYSQLENFKTWIGSNTDDENHNKWLKEAEYLIAKKAYQDKALEYKQAKAIYDELSTRVSKDSPGLLYQRKEAAKALLGVDYNVSGAAAARDALLSENLDNVVADLDKDSQTFNNVTSIGNASIDHNIFKEALGGGLFGKWYDAAIATAKAQDEYDDARAAVYTNNPSTSSNLADAEAAVAAAKAQLDLAADLYADAVAEYNADQDIVVYINLLNDVTEGGTADKWQILPTTVANDTAYFYYTGILEGGETSAQLIDSVELAPTVTQDMYDYFDFDLNISLKSAQVTYDEEGRITNDAANDELDADVTVKEPASIESALVWTAKN